MSRARKSAAQHKAEGTYREDRHGEPEAIALAPVTQVNAPDWLPADLVPIWQTVAADLCAMGALCPSDLVLLEQAFRLMENATRIQELIDNEFLSGEGVDVKDLAKLTASLTGQVAAYERILSKFGVTPSERARLLHLLPRRKGKEGESLDDLLT